MREHPKAGGAQYFPFTPYPHDQDLPEDQPLGAESVHHQLRRWLVQVAHRPYADTAV